MRSLNQVTVVFDRVSVVHAQHVIALNDVTLEIGSRELWAVIGPSGSGKSTLLRVIAGLETLSSGRLLVDGEDLLGVAPADRDVAMVFQDHALYSHKTAGGNLSFPLEVRGVDESERTTRVVKIARLLGLGKVLDRRPKVLSLGQRNAVATGRALVRNPRILLLDEPLANLDARTRLRARIEIRRRHHESGATTIYATNDQSEALAVADRVVVLNRGMVQQIDTPEGVYDRPANLFVARFVGTPPMNAMTGLIEPRYPDYVWRPGESDLTIPNAVVERSPRLHEFMGRQVVLAVRAEHLRSAASDPFKITLHGICLRIEDHGDSAFALVDLGNDVVTVRLHENSTALGVGNPAEIAVDVNHLHFFDPETGLAL